MAIAVKPIDQSMERWERNSANAAGDYVKGAKNPKRPWMQSTLAAEANYKIEVIKAANAGRQGAGVRKAGDASWIGGIERKGEANYGTGTAGAGPDWANGSRPFQTAVSQANIPARGAKNSADNYRRSQMVGDTQHKLKEQMLNASR